MVRILQALGFIFILLIGFTEFANATSSKSAPGKIYLLSENASIADHTNLVWLGIYHKLEQGWHTYWRYPGDSGLPLKVHWTRSANAVVGEINWPVPTVFKAGPLVTYGYEKEALLLIPVTVQRKEAIELAGTIDWLVCREICIPQRSKVGIKIPVGDGRLNNSMVELFERTRSSVPSILPGKARAYFDLNKIILNLKIPGNLLNSLRSVTFLPMLDGLIENSKPQEWKTRLGTENSLEVQMTAGYALDDGLRKLDGLLILKSDLNKEYQRKAFDLLNVPLFNITRKNNVGMYRD